MEPTTNNVEDSRQYWDLGEVEEEEAFSSAWFLVADSVKWGVLKAVIDLDVLEIIKKRGRGAHLSAAEIATKLPTGNPKDAAATLGRLLDILVSHSVFTVTPITLPGGTIERRYGLAPVCKFFFPNGVSLTPFLENPIRNHVDESLNYLKDAVLEGSVPFTKAHGMTIFEYMGKNLEYQKSFQKAMSDHSTLVMRQIIKTYKGFEGLPSLVDVGGSSGASLNMIISQYPTIKGINFDEPYVVAKASSYPGVEHVGGNMFVNIPKGDAMFLKWICHCFNDEACITILKNCYAALPEDHGKVIICEHLLPDAHEITTNKDASSAMHLDAVVLAMQGGKERTRKEFEALALAAGFEGFQVVCFAYNVYIMELLKRK